MRVIRFALNAISSLHLRRGPELIALLGLWLAYTDNVGIREGVAGALGAAISVVAALLYSRQGNVRFQFQIRHIAQAFYLFWYALDGTWEILRALAQQLFTPEGAPSFMAAVPFEVGDDAPATRGRRALATTYTTITPNFVVLGIVKERG